MTTPPLARGAPAAARAARYADVLAALDAWLNPRADAVAAMATAAALLHASFDAFDWTGFYRVHGDQLVVGPYQGPPACTAIPWARGVCGLCAARGAPIVVPDVRSFEGYIACSDATRSEVVVPVHSGERVAAVLDVDSDEPNAFDDADVEGLTRVAARVASHFLAPTP